MKTWKNTGKPPETDRRGVRPLRTLTRHESFSCLLTVTSARPCGSCPSSPRSGYWPRAGVSRFRLNSCPRKQPIGDRVHERVSHRFVEGYVATASRSNSPNRYGRVALPVFFLFPPRVLCVSTTYVSAGNDRKALLASLARQGRPSLLRCSFTCTRTSPFRSLRRKSYGRSLVPGTFRQPFNRSTTSTSNAASAITPRIIRSVRPPALWMASRMISALVCSSTSNGWMENSCRRWRKTSSRWAGLQRLSRCLIRSLSLMSPSPISGARRRSAGKKGRLLGSRACVHRRRCLSGAPSGRA